MAELRPYLLSCEMYKCKDNSEGVCTCEYPIIGENCTCLAYIPRGSKEAELHEQIDKITADSFSQLGLSPSYSGEDLAQNPDVTAYPDRHTAIGKPDGNCLDCNFQYRDDSEHWCSICPGNPEDI